MPFGAGTRVCGGQALAQVVLRIVIAAVVSNFNVSANGAETNEQTMEMRDAFVRRICVAVFTWLIDVAQVLFPAARECKLTFSTRKH